MVTEAEVRAWFQQQGVPIATQTETEAQRLARITNQINSGQRSTTEVQGAIQGLASGTVTYSPTGSAYYGGTTSIQQDLVNVAGGAEVWTRPDGSTWLVYTAPGTDIYMAWQVTSQSDLESYFGPGGTITYSRYATDEFWGNSGVIDFGDANEIINTSKNPFSTWEQDLARRAETQPWLYDADYMQLLAMAQLEGRELYDWEIQSTNWYRSHSDTQRQWMMLLNSNPAQAQMMIDAAIAQLSEQFRLSGGGQNVNPGVLSWLAENMLAGNITQTDVQLQIRALTDPYSGIPIMPGLAQMVSGVTQTTAREDEVRSLLHTWLGPLFGAWDDSEIARIAGDLRNDPNAMNAFVESLKDQRMVLLPEYQDRNISYQAIANTWKQWWMGQWGQAPDETSDLWLQVLKANDTDYSGQLLRKEGLERGIGKVIDAANSAALDRSMGLVRSPV